MHDRPRCAAMLSILLFVGLQVHAADETREPPVKYRLEVEGKSYTLVEGEPLKLSGTLTDPTVKLVAESYREFTYGGATFQSKMMLRSSG